MDRVLPKQSTGTPTAVREPLLSRRERKAVTPTFDADGYPSEQTEQLIANWPIDDSAGWLDYCIAAWNQHYGSVREENGLVTFATGGWSGNESIRLAMHNHYVLWLFHWESSHRRGAEVYRRHPNSLP